MRLGGCRTCVQRGPTRDAASDAVACALVPRLSFFFFFLRFAPTRLDSRCSGSIHAKSASICTEPARIGLYRPYWVVSTGDQYSWNKPETAETGKNWHWIWLEKSKFSPQRHSNVFLAFFFLCFVNQGIVMCFLRIF